jgi:Ca-activated chloride channel family protein
MNFAAPNMLWLVPMVVGPLILFFWWSWRRKQQLITQFISSRLLTQLKVGVSAARQKARMAMMVAAVVLLICALARPQWGLSSEEAHQRGLDIVVAIDTSRSMLAEDVPPNRLARAKLAAIDLVRRAKTDRLGLVAFAGTAFLQCPLTLDDAAFSQSVDSLDTHTLSQGGTAIAEAINEARKAFKSDGDNHKVLVLFTDGEDQDTEAVGAAEKAAKDGMIIFTVGIGTADGDQLRVRDARGRVETVKDETGRPVQSKLNEDLLRQIATTAHGFYLPLTGAKTMDVLYEHGLEPLPKTDNSVRMFQRYRERFYWPLGLAMACLILEMFFPDRKHVRRRPGTPAAQASQTGVFTGTTALLCLLLSAVASQAGGANSALREYKQGNFDRALQDYNQLLEKKQDDPRLHFNAGAAAYQARNLDKAVKEFNEALKSQDLQLQQRAYYNLANSYYRLGENNQDPSKKQKAWETALQQYTNALSLNKLDPDADYNRTFVENRLEELKKQNPPSQSDKNDKNDKKDDKKDQNKDGQNKNDQQKNDEQQKQDQQKQDQQQSQNQQDQKQQDQQKQDQSKSDKQDGKKDDQKDTAQNQGSGKSEEDKEKQEQAEKEAKMMEAGEMTPSQALQLLDAQKGEEQVLKLGPNGKQNSQGKTMRDW